jgi:hydroxyethylthiazole kinase-like uncharacterized protein yjeF
MERRIIPVVALHTFSRAQDLAAVLAVTPPDGPWPLHDASASRTLERLALSACATGSLMEQAGLAVARLARAMAPHAERAWIVAGPGNNGGDGLVAARHLHMAGLQVRVRYVGETSSQAGDAREALCRAKTHGVPLAPFDPDEALSAGRNDIAIDALLGLGTARAPVGRIAQAIERLNTMPCQRLAVDIPTGLHTDTGAVLGQMAVRAQATLSLLTLKPGCFTGSGRDHAGQVWWAPLGVEHAAPTAWLAGPAAISARSHVQHKGSFGDVLVVGGAPGMTGAARLAATAALAAGAGRVYVSLLDMAHHAPLEQPELMQRSQGWRATPAVLAGLTVVCGCGGGNDIAAVLPPLLAHAGKLVLDADALNAVAHDSALRAQLLARGRRTQATILTPHPLEAARLLGCSTQQVQAARVQAATDMAADFGCCVVLKGSGTVVARPGELPSINPTGNASLGTGGTGDVLAGWTGGLWARHGSDASLATAAAVAADACWQHGAAADRHVAAGRQSPLLAGHLITAMAAGWR